MNSNLKDGTRSFGGKISGFENQKEANFERAHLKNYLKGNKTFKFGFTWDSAFSRRIPITHKVKEVLN